MALVNCPECGKESSDKAAACPYCGCTKIEFHKTKEDNTKPRKKYSASQWIVTILVGIVLYSIKGFINLSIGLKHGGGALLAGVSGAAILGVCSIIFYSNIFKANREKERTKKDWISIAFVSVLVLVTAYLYAALLNEDPTRQANLKDRQQAKIEKILGIGEGATKKENVADPFEEMLRAAEHGDAEAQYKLAGAHKWGFSAPQDPAKAMYWYHKAAEQGHPRAQNELGNIYSSGVGFPHVPQDRAKAAYWYQKAAAQGLAEAQYSLGTMYTGQMYRDGSQGVPQDFPMGVQLLEKAAEQGNKFAQNALAMLYLDGKGVKRDRKKGCDMLRAAAEQWDRDRTSGTNIFRIDYNERCVLKKR